MIGFNLTLMSELFYEARELVKLDKDIDLKNFDHIDQRKTQVLTTKGQQEVEKVARNAVTKMAKLLLKIQESSSGNNPHQSREEVTGMSTKGTNKNMSNSGFGGGGPMRLAAA